MRPSGTAAHSEQKKRKIFRALSRRLSLYVDIGIEREWTYQSKDKYIRTKNNYMYVCVCVCMYACIYTCIHVCIYTYINQSYIVSNAMGRRHGFVTCK